MPIIVELHGKRDYMAGTRPLRAGVIGGGEIAQVAHLPAYESNDSTVIAGVADLDPERRRSAAREFEVQSAYERGDKLIAEESLDIVSICTPPSTHESLFEDAAARGINIYCEKPVSTGYASAERMEACAEEHDIITQVGYTLQYANNYQKVRTYVENGLLGDVLSADIHCIIPSPSTPWRYDREIAGGGIVSDMLPHWLHYYTELFGERPTVESSRVERVKTADVEDFASIELSYGDIGVGITMQWIESGLTSKSVRRNTLSAAEGTIEFDQERLQGSIRGKGVSFKHGQSPRIGIGPLFQVWGRTSEELFTKPVHDFIEHVRRGDTQTGAPISRGVEMMSVIEDIYEVGETR